MSRYVIATIKSWNVNNFYKLVASHAEDEFFLVTEPEKLTLDWLKEIKPDFVFFPHWSWIIKKEIYEAFSCVVFHMTDLPFGRGGSPLQNLLARGIYETKISAIAVEAGLDTGDVYLKRPINISEGNADDILSRVSDVVFQEMIPQIIKERPKPVPQKGEIVTFQRRKPADSLIDESLHGRRLYDFIRMLDGEGYPPAYRLFGEGKIIFRNARMHGEEVISDAYFLKGDPKE